MYVRVLFMSEFPGLRHIVKIRDFYPYLSGQSDPGANIKRTKPPRKATLQITLQTPLGALISIILFSTQVAHYSFGGFHDIHIHSHSSDHCEKK